MHSITTSRELAIKLHKLNFILQRISDQALQAELGVSFSQFLTLTALKHRPGTSQAAVANFLGVTPAAVSRQIELLLRQKLISKHPDSRNRRQSVLGLSAEGRETINRAIRALDQTTAEALAPLGKRRQAEMLSHVETLLTAIRDPKDWLHG